MTITQLRCFVEVAQELNYAKAAANLFISQPAVSRHIVSLEADLGISLFIRDRHKVALTAAGNRFYSEAKDILERIELSRTSLLSNEGNETLNIGCVSSLQISKLSEIFSQFHKQVPDVIISNTEIGTSDYRRVATGDHLDVAFVPSSAKRIREFADSGLRFFPLYSCGLCCVIRKDHPLAGRESTTFDDLEGETLILLDHEHCPQEMEDVQYDIRRSCNNIKYYYSGSSLYTIPMVVAGLGVAVMPDFVCPPSADILCVPFTPSPKLGYGLICRSNDKSKKVKAFIDVAMSCF